MPTLCIIAARGGSKGLINKNTRQVGGKPLIAHSIEHAMKSGVCDRVLVTTDSEDIKQAALDAGAWVPFMRDPALAQDLTPTEPVLKDALERAEEIDKCTYDIVVFLQPTDIFRNPKWIKQAVEILKEDSSVDTAFAASKTHKNFWYQGEDGQFKRVFDWMAIYGPRQTRTPIFREDTGLASAIRADLIKSGRRTGDNVRIIETNDFATSIDIHNEFDLYMAEKALEYLKDTEIS